MKKGARNTAAGLAFLLFGSHALADVFVTIPNAAQLSFQSSGADIYLRNLNTFDSNALGCCYSYWIDTSTAEGKNIFALLLEDIALSQPITLGLPNGYASGAVTYSGNNF